MNTLDPSLKSYWSRTPQQRDDEAAAFEVAPSRAKFLEAMAAYVETLDDNSGFACPLGRIADYSADEAAKALLGYIEAWEGDYVRKEVLSRESE